MHHLLVLLLAYVAYVLQAVLSPQLAIAGVSPDFLLLAVLLIASVTDGASAVMWGAFLGLLADCLAGGRLGVGMLAASAAVWFVGRSRRRYAGEPGSGASMSLIPAALGLAIAFAHPSLVAAEWQPSAPLRAAGVAVYSLTVGLLAWGGLAAGVFVWRRLALAPAAASSRSRS